jgi:outer membrane protein assembly factor BamA
MLLPALALSLLCAATPEARKERGFDALGVPLVSYNSDVGFGYGAVGGAYFYSPGYKPYRHGVALQAFFTTGGVQNHWLRYDGPQFFKGARIEARLEWRRELFTPYYGPGNVASPEFDNDFSDLNYNYDRVSPGGWVRVRTHPLGQDHPFQQYFGYGYKWNDIRPYPGSLLERDQPVGIAGGSTGQLLFGLLWDTRNDESDPTQGGLEEVSLRLSAEPTGSRYQFGGVTLAERRFWTLGSPRFVFAQRLALDLLFGDVPFFEWTGTGGINYLEGIGGMSSVRGVPRNRYGGNLKVISNSELRFYPYEFQLFGAPVKVGGLAFFDLGRAWHPGVDDGEWYNWHPGVGAGVRLVRRAAVVRFDYAFAPEEVRHGVYVTFGHMF